MKIRLLTALVGDVKHKLDMRTKYGLFYSALAGPMDLVEHYDATLTGFARYQSALLAFHPMLSIWKERYFRNEFAFVKRSQNITRHLQALNPSVDAVLQLGGMFDATWAGSRVPVFVYTDNTTAITARHPEAGRFAFSQRELEGWLKLEQKLYQRSAHLFVRSNIAKHSLIHDYVIQPEKISVVGGGVNFEQLPPLPTRNSRPEPTILFIGQDFHRKGGDLLLKAFARVRERFPAVRLIMVTSDMLPKNLPLEGVTHLDFGWDRKSIEALFPQADIFALPARQETWGDVLLEAMAYGVPCLGVTGQAMEDIIQHAQTGFLIPPSDVEALAAYLLRLLEDPDLRWRMGLQAYNYVSRHFTWNHVAAQMFPVIEAKV